MATADGTHGNHGSRGGGTDGDRRGDEAVRFTSELIRIDTTNRGGGDCRERPAAEYAAERLAEAGLSPLVLESAPGRANVVARIGGSEPGLPALLVHGHLDVVPAQAEDWSVPPFSGEIRDGVVWGRGAVDMKGMDAMMLAVVRAWARERRGPRRDVVLCFTADEEDSAAAGADWLVRQHADLFEGCTEAVGESGAYTVHTGAGQRLYPVAAGERGTGWLRLTARGTAGHGSKVNHANAVTRLAAAVTRIGEHAWPVRITPTVREALLAVGAATGVPLEPDEVDDPGFDADGYLAKLDPAAAKLIAATVRNSANPTVLQAGYKTNVIPGLAVAEIDGRTLPGLTGEFEAVLDELTGPDVDWSYLHRETALTAPVDSPTFAAMGEALLAHDPGAAVVPFCMSGGTDAKQFSRLGITGYGFSPLRLPPGYDFQGLFHGVDERVPAEALRFGAAVLDDFLSTVG
ncbi:M20/M25/M40 family metallo-hydrolase [Streptacidiphilus sp. PB12-B1b]|uniref:M20/M25/M40 family metallo-hydrolase n=1 Tax=Streptacidiphilus sp. PB12-B1b TaxID=2705012 RepID=UPI0015F9F090|nr:M20/M25/M40 family metallo-hydrolase [Streptacidiphilus sp. PB12-B1b]QMU76137.1 M20/M25/M40 family metallo-hydrolase [Streptacidiphilus sp. PB12-B1b]